MGLVDFAPAIEAAGAIATSATSGLFGANQARKNRAFQERMYNKQVEDNRKNWEMVNEYNLPSAQLQRLKDAGLNPYLMYSEGAGNGMATVAQGGSLPSGSQGSAHFSNPFQGFTQSLAQMKLLDSQIQNIDAQTENIEAQTKDTEAHADWQRTEAQFNHDNYLFRLALSRGDVEQCNVLIEKLRTDMFNDTRLSTQQVLTYQQSREMELKRFQFDKDTMGERLKQMWQDVKSGRIQANAAMKNASAAWLNASTQANLSNWQIGMMAQEFLYNQAANPLKLRSLTLDNTLKRWDTHLKKATLNEKQVNIVNQNLRNYNLRTYGSEELYKSQLGGTIRDVSAPFVNLGNALFSW